MKPAAVLATLLFCSAAVLPAPASAALDALVRETMSRQRIAGISLAVSRSGELATARGYGFARNFPKTAARPQTVYPIGSITKQFTAAATLREVQAGRISMDAPIQTYLPQLALPASVTVATLLYQTSGIPSYEDVVAPSNKTPAEDIAAVVARVPLRFTPSSHFEYSNSNALLLGLLLEQLERRPYCDIVHSWFTGPLELNETSCWAQPALTTQGYDDTGKAVALEPQGYLFAAAGMTSNVLDLVRWEDALYAGSVLGDADTARLFSPFTLPDASSTGYGMAAYARTIDGRAVYYQTGNVSGYSAIVLHQTHAHLTVAVLTNRDRFDLLPLLKSILRIFDPAPEHAR